MTGFSEIKDRIEDLVWGTVENEDDAIRELYGIYEGLSPSEREWLTRQPIWQEGLPALQELFNLHVLRNSTPRDWLVTARGILDPTVGLRAGQLQDLITAYRGFSNEGRRQITEDVDWAAIREAMDSQFGTWLGNKRGWWK